MKFLGVLLVVLFSSRRVIGLMIIGWVIKFVVFVLVILCMS